MKQILRHIEITETVQNSKVAQNGASKRIVTKIHPVCGIEARQNVFSFVFKRFAFNLQKGETLAFY
jgi:hypothetical protein